MKKLIFTLVFAAYNLEGMHILNDFNVSELPRSSKLGWFTFNVYKNPQSNLKLEINQLYYGNPNSLNKMPESPPEVLNKNASSEIRMPLIRSHSFEINVNGDKNGSSVVTIADLVKRQNKVETSSDENGNDSSSLFGAKKVSQDYIDSSDYSSDDDEELPTVNDFTGKSSDNFSNYKTQSNNQIGAFPERKFTSNMPIIKVSSTGNYLSGKKQSVKLPTINFSSNPEANIHQASSAVIFSDFSKQALERTNFEIALILERLDKGIVSIVISIGRNNLEDTINTCLARESFKDPVVSSQLKENSKNSIIMRIGFAWSREESTIMQFGVPQTDFIAFLMSDELAKGSEFSEVCKEEIKDKSLNPAWQSFLQRFIGKKAKVKNGRIRRFCSDREKVSMLPYAAQHLINKSTVTLRKGPPLY